MVEKRLNIVMYPWLAMGHIIPYLQLANKFGERGHSVTLIVPNKAKLMIQSSNLHPSLINIHTITVPHLDHLPPGTETNAEIPFHLETHLATALDLVRPQFESVLHTIQPNLVIFDFACWVPEAVAACTSNARCVSYCVSFAVAISYAMNPSREPPMDRAVVEGDTCVVCAPPGYPSSKVVLDPKILLNLYMPFGEGFTFYQRITTSLKCSDAIAVKTCREIEGKYCDYLSSVYNKPVLSVLDLPEPEQAELDPRWAKWLSQFEQGSVVFCAFGSQVVLDVAQFQELLLGFEMTTLPFLVAFKPPTGFATVEEAFPEGFTNRVRERGVVTGEWVPQPQILAHPSVGCFVSHCGSGSIWESMMSESQIVLIPQLPDQVMFSKIMTEEVKVAVQVDRGEDGSWISKQNLCNAIKSVMDESSEVGTLVKKNHEILRQKLLDPSFMRGNIDTFIKDLQALVA